MKNIRLITFTGQTDELHCVRYRLDEDPERLGDPRYFFAVAICDYQSRIGNPITSVVRIGTTRSLIDREDEWYQCERRNHYWHKDLVCGEGGTESERWGIFHRVIEGLSHEELSENGRSEPAPDEILVDVTHGYRAHPMLGLAAVSFVLSEWARRGLPRPPDIRILYAAPPAAPREGEGDGDVASVWDLTVFIQATEWNKALDALLRFGRADDLARLAKQDSRSEVQALGDKARAFADDLCTVRLRDLIRGSPDGPGSSTVLVEAIDKAKDALARQVGSALESAQNELTKLEATATLNESGLRAAATLSDYYGRIQRFAEQAIVIRESLVTHANLAFGWPSAPEPGNKEIRLAREFHEVRWLSIAKDDLDGLGDAMVTARDNIQKWRNDIGHAGLRPKPLSSEDLRQGLEDSATDLRKLVEQPLPAGTDRSVALRTVLNLTATPGQDWSEHDKTSLANVLGSKIEELRIVDAYLAAPSAGSSRAAFNKYVKRCLRRTADEEAGAVVIPATPLEVQPALVSELCSHRIHCFFRSQVDSGWAEFYWRDLEEH